MERDNLSFYENGKPSQKVSIVSVPLELGSDVRGHADAPKFLKENGFLAMLGCIGAEVSHSTSLFCGKPPMQVSAGSMKNVKEIASVAKRASALVEKTLRRKEIALVLGGDHSAAIGSLAGASKVVPSLGVIYIDAHPDCNTESTTITGNIHGFVTAIAMGEGHPMLTDIVSKKIPPENFIYIGLKDIDAAEIEFLRSRNIQCFTLLDIAEHGLSQILPAIDALQKRVDSIWVSMDMDSIDQKDAPGVGLPNPEGLTRREVLTLAQYVGKSVRLAGLDIVEIVPAKDVEKKTAALAIELVARFLGSEYSWYRNYIKEYSETNVTSHVVSDSKH